MIFQALVRRQRYWLTLVAIAICIFYSLPVFAGFSWSVPFSMHQDYDSSLKTEIIVAEGSASLTPRKQEVSLFQQLDLTPEQQQQIKQIHLQYQAKIRQKEQEIAKLQQELSDMMVGTAPIKSLRAKNQQLSKTRLEMQSLHFESMLATREILTPQQRLKFRALVKNAAAIR